MNREGWREASPHLINGGIYMVKVAVTSLKAGQTLLEDVRTQFGSLLMEKGRVISDRDIEVLRAFLIDAVEVDAAEDTLESNQETAADVVINGPYRFYQLYRDLFQLLNRAFRVVAAGTDELPLLEIRKKIEEMAVYLEFYNPLTFAPRRLYEDNYYIHQGILTGFTSLLIAQWQGMPKKDWTPIVMAGLFHDIGNTRIDPDILRKPASLTESEFEEVKKHTVIGYQILKNIPGLNEGVLLSALQHHERYDGTGYPLGVKGDKIHPYANIVAVADIFHAMTSERNFKEASSPYVVLEQLSQDAFGKLDPAVVQTFIQKITQLHIGMKVRLNDGSVGEIVFTDRNRPTRPMVNVQGHIVNLATEVNKFIKEVISE